MVKRKCSAASSIANLGAFAKKKLSFPWLSQSKGTEIACARNMMVSTDGSFVLHGLMGRVILCLKEMIVELQCCLKIWKFFTQTQRFMDAYRKVLSGKQVAWASKKYRGHHMLPEKIMEELDAAGVTMLEDYEVFTKIYSHKDRQMLSHPHGESICAVPGTGFVEPQLFSEFGISVEPVIQQAMSSTVSTKCLSSSPCLQAASRNKTTDLKLAATIVSRWQACTDSITQIVGDCASTQLSGIELAVVIVSC
ncbi:hypothetical protein C8Q80DRAFT_1121264 [Daedaleopsis nitida]|nr:hypothetical protein C8Q80DRAFT_1121264 [Daedaleopsis nitida]